MDILLDNGAKPFLINKNNRSAIYPVLNYYYYPIFDNLERNDLIFQQFYENDSISNTEQPVAFMFDELKNHLQKLLNKQSDNNKVLDMFAFNQYNPINLIIKGNTRFGNNILRHMRLSYSIVGYLINQYFFKNLFNLSKEFKLVDLERIFNVNGINRCRLVYKDMMDDVYLNQINRSNIANYLEEILEETSQEITKISDKVNKIRASNNELARNLYPFRETTRLNDLINSGQDLLRSRISIRNLLNGVRIRGKLRRPVNNDEDIIQFYDDFIEHNGSNRGSYVLLWEKYFEDNLNTDKNLVMLSSSRNIFDSLDRLNILNARLGDFDVLRDNSGIYHQSAEIAENYFKAPRYLESNQLLFFIKKVLIHMTQNIICYNFEVAIRKTIFKYLYNRSSSPNLDDIIRIIDNIFISVSNLRRPLSTTNNTMQDILYRELAEELVINSSNIFNNRTEELNFSSSSANEIFSNYVNLIEISSSTFEEGGELMKNLGFIVDYFSEISTQIINNWYVTIENYLRFVINQNRINKTFKDLRKRS